MFDSQNNDQNDLVFMLHKTVGKFLQKKIDWNVISVWERENSFGRKKKQI